MQTEMRPPRKRFSQIWEKVAAIALIAIVVGGLLYLIDSTSHIKWSYIQEKFPDFLWPAALTLLITVGSYFVGMLIGFSLGLVRTSKYRLVRIVATGWVEAIRGTPLFVQLLFLFALFSFYNPGDLPLPTRLILTGFIAMMINTGAYQAEIFRGGLQSVSAGQIEAAKAIGMGYWGTMFRVIIPQAFRVIIPPLTNEFILMLKASALLALINVKELTYYAKIESFTGNLVEAYLIVTTLYLLMTVPLAKVIAYLERRYRIPGVGLQQETTARARKGSKSVVARMTGVDFLSRSEARVSGRHMGIR